MGLKVYRKNLKRETIRELKVSIQIKLNMTPKTLIYPQANNIRDNM